VAGTVVADVVAEGSEPVGWESVFAVVDCGGSATNVDVVDEPSPPLQDARKIAATTPMRLALLNVGQR
jgi:hypothetical protein